MTLPIVLEGPDGGGKSTLLKVLGRRYKGWEVRHSGGPIRDKEDLKQRKRDFRKNQQIIWDRLFYVSEYVYAPYFGRDVPAELLLIDDAPQALYIWCLPENLELSEQNNPRFDTPEYVEKLKQTRAGVIATYQAIALKFAQDRPYHSVVYDWKNLGQILWACDRHVYGNSIPMILQGSVTHESFTRELTPLTGDPRNPVEILRRLHSDEEDLSPQQSAAIRWALDFIRRNW